MTGMDDGMDFIAHVCQDEKGNGLPPHPLEQHLLNTAELAGKFASKFNTGLWGKLAGLSHDAGKGRCAWQYYHRQKSGYFDEEAHLEGKPGKMAYAIFGAKLVEEIHGKQIGRVISCCVAGHHGGLQDWSSGEGAGKSSLEYQLSQVDAVNDIHTPIRDVLGTVRPQALPWAFSSGLDISLWIRMLYSCLVDPHPGWIAVPSPLVIRCDAAAVPTLRRRSPGRPIARSRKGRSYMYRSAPRWQATAQTWRGPSSLDTAPISLGSSWRLAALHRSPPRSGRQSSCKKVGTLPKRRVASFVIGESSCPAVTSAAVCARRGENTPCISHP